VSSQKSIEFGPFAENCRPPKSQDVAQTSAKGVAPPLTRTCRIGYIAVKNASRIFVPAMYYSPAHFQFTTRSLTIVSLVLFTLVTLCARAEAKEPMVGQTFFSELQIFGDYRVPLPQNLRSQWELTLTNHHQNWGQFVLRNVDERSALKYLLIRAATNAQMSTPCDWSDMQSLVARERHGTLQSQRINKCTQSSTSNGLPTTFWPGMWSTISKGFTGQKSQDTQYLRLDIALQEWGGKNVQVLAFISLDAWKISADEFKRAAAGDFRIDELTAVSYRILNIWATEYLESIDAAHQGRKKVIELPDPPEVFTLANLKRMAGEAVFEAEWQKGGYAIQESTTENGIANQPVVEPEWRQGQYATQEHSVTDNRLNQPLSEPTAQKLSAQSTRPLGVPPTPLPASESTPSPPATSSSAQVNATPVTLDPANQQKPDEAKAKLEAEVARLREELAKRTFPEKPPAPDTVKPALILEARRVALVIGNDSYRTVTPLENARTDARAVAKALTKIGYTVTLKTDLGERPLKDVLRSFKNSIQGGDEILFYYAGHGLQLGGTNYLLPIDIRADSADQVEDDALPLQKVLDDFQDRRAKFSLAIIDACRDNPFKGTGRNIGSRGLAPTTAATGQMVMFSAGAGQKALDRLSDSDKDPNGLFTRILLKQINTQGVSVDQLLRRVRREVVSLARSVGHEQVPALYDQAVGEFFFRK